MDWFKDGSALAPSDRISVVPGQLMFTQTLEEDRGTYTCRAKVVKTGNVESRRIAFDVFIPPEFLKDLEDVSAVEGEEIQIHCSAEGHPAPKYLWKNKDNADLSKLDGYTVEENGKLIIHSVSRDDGGDYTCEASNDADMVENSLQLTVLLKPQILQYDNITVSVGEKAVIECKVSGDPLPGVTINKEGRDPYQEGLQADNARVNFFKLEDNGNAIGKIEINPVERGDDGLYACHGENSGGKIFQNGHIEVQFPPVFPDLEENKEVWSWNNRRVELECFAEAIPNATISWTKAGKDIENDLQVEVSYENGKSILKVNPVDVSYFGNYLCHAKNNILPDPEPRLIILKEAQVPGTIHQAVFAKKTGK